MKGIILAAVERNAEVPYDAAGMQAAAPSL